MGKMFSLATAAVALALAAPAVAAPTISSTDGSPLANQIFGIVNTATTVYGASPSNNGVPSVTFTGDTTIHMGSGFAQINDADYDSKDPATQDWFTLIINPDLIFSDFKFSVQLKESGTINVFYLLTGSLLNANAFASYTSSAGAFSGGNGNVNQLLTGGNFDGFMIKTSSPIELFEIKQLSFNAVAPVPEPATWAMMLIGFAGVGIGLRRRRKQQNGRLLQIA